MRCQAAAVLLAPHLHLLQQQLIVILQRLQAPLGWAGGSDRLHGVAQGAAQLLQVLN